MKTIGTGSGVRIAAAGAIISVILCAAKGGSMPGAFFLRADYMYASQADDTQKSDVQSNDELTGDAQADDSQTGDGNGDQVFGIYEPAREEVKITVPGMEDACTLWWISDMHIVSRDDPGVSDEHKEEARERYEMFQSPSGRPACETWELLSDQIDSGGADYVVFGGDMMDYVSEENLIRLKEGLQDLKTPWMYLRADHDYGRWFGEMRLKKMRALHRSIAPQNHLWAERFDEFTLAGLDNTTSAPDAETVEEFRALCAEGNPVILCTHVPFDTGSGDTDLLKSLSREGWGDRVLCWGDGDAYDTSSGGTMKEILEIICAPDSPVVAVLAGHLHLTWDGALTDTCKGHVFSAAYEDKIGVITVSGE